MNKTKGFIYILTFLFIQTLNAQVQKETVPLYAVLKKIEQQFDCHFSFADQTIEGILISDLPEFKSLRNSLTFLKQQTQFQFVVLKNKYVSISPSIEQRLCGYLVDFETNDPIENVVISDGVNSVLSSENGYFEFEEKSIDALVRFSHLSFKGVQYQLKDMKIGSCEVIYLVPKVERISEVIVKNYLTKGIQKTAEGSYKINYEKFDILPGLIEPDVLLSIQALPGIQSVDETVSNINIRGGTHHENLMLWDGIKMYQSGHFFGLISAFNPYLTKQAVLVKNGTEANLSEGVSGTVLMTTSQKVSKEFSAEVGLNLINADALIDLPISKKSSIQLAGRKSINSIVKTPTYKQYFDKAFQNSEVVKGSENVIHSDDDFSFSDLNVRWLYDITDYDKLSMNFILFNNNVVFSENAIVDGVEESKESNASQNNLAGGLNYYRDWSNRFQTNLNLYITKYDLKSTNHDLLNNQRLIQENEVLESAIKFDSEYKVSEIISLYNGYQYQETGITNIQDVDNPLFQKTVKQVVRSHGLSSEVGFRSINNKTKARVGVRLNYLEQFGNYILEPRLSLSHNLASNLTVQILGEKKHQTSSQIVDFQDDFLGIENRRWVLTNNEVLEEDEFSIPIVESLQGSLGLFYNNKGWLLSAEGYVKNVNGITTRSQGFQNQYQYVNETGSYDVFGLDLLIRKRFAKFNSWLSYSYVDNEYTFDALAERVFPSNFDIRHTVSFATTYSVKQFDFSAGLNWHTGKPTTKPVEGNEIIAGEINYELANSSRLDDYMRVDLSGQYQFKMSDKVKGSFGISVWNLLNKESVTNSYYKIIEDGTVQQVNQISLGLTPNASFRVYF